MTKEPGHLSQPSPSFGPPLLSASWSPPLFCGITQGAVDGELAPLAAGVFEGVAVLPLWHPPSASSMTSAAIPGNTLSRLTRGSISVATGDPDGHR